MKKFIILLLILSFFGLIGHAETLYQRKDCQVVDISGATITVKDRCGFYWSFCAKVNDDYKINDIITLKMNDNHTSGNISDDKVISVIR